MWARGFCAELGNVQEDPTALMVDNQNVLTLVQNLLSSNKVRHITRRELIVREREASGDIKVVKVYTLDNIADIFTKVLDRDPFTKLRKGVMQLLRVGPTAVRLMARETKR